VDDPDQFSPEQSVHCPEDALDALVFWAEDAPVSMYWATRRLAKALERNGRSEEALDLLESVETRDPSDAPSSPDLRIWGPDDPRRMWANVEMGHVLFRMGRWGAALEKYEAWRSTSGCGNCASWEMGERDQRRDQCLLALERHAEAREICEKQIVDPWGGEVAPFVECFLESHRRIAGVEAADRAIEELEARAPEYQKDEIRSAHIAWKIRH
jgi:hypothetical protein